MDANDKIFQKILAELREINRFNQGPKPLTEEILAAARENKDILTQMAAYLTNYQQIVDFVLKDTQKQNQALMHELKSQFTRLAVLVNPELIGAYRTNYKILSSESDPVWSVDTDFTIKMAENANPGVITNRAFYRTGFLANVSTTSYQYVDEGYPTCPGTAQILRIVSTSANDTSGGTGANIVEVTGLDANFNRIFETVTMNGATPVFTVNQFTHVEELDVITVGSNQFAVGEITMTNTAVSITYGHIASGNNAWQSGRFHTAANDAAYVHGWTFGAYNATVRAQLMISTVNGFALGSVTAKAAGISNNDTFSIVFPVPVKVPSLGIVRVRALSKGPNSEVNTSFALWAHT